MNPVVKIKSALRGGVGLRALALETFRRTGAALAARRERALLTGRKGAGDAGARLSAEFQTLTAAQLLEHFRAGKGAVFLPGFEEAAQDGSAPRKFFPSESEQVIERAARIVEAHRWPLLGYGEQDFSAAFDWLRDPVSGARWPLDYHRDVRLVRGDGGDVRVVWELNRLSHLLTLARGYAIERDGRFAREFFRQVRYWRAKNPVGFGPNWACAMEVSLRAMNLLAAFSLLRRAPELNEGNLSMMLALFDEHGAHIRRNLEYSYITTSNHYLTDVVGLVWLGTALPELGAAREWREWGLREMLGEMDKQVLSDGADDEASTGYHRLVTELFLYTFILCLAGGVQIDERYWQRLRAMLEYMRVYLRPDLRAPLIGDTDSGQVLPLRQRTADEHAYVLAVGAGLFKEPRFKVSEDAPEELFWMLGAEGLRTFESLPAGGASPASRAFTDAGTYVCRERDLYLLFNVSGVGLRGRGSHAHNDALSVEVSACGTSFIRDPGTYVYTADFAERGRFRSTAYHSTVEVDGAEQNTIDEQQPFRIGDEARPRLVQWEKSPERDLVIAEHDGYRRLAAGPVTHRRTVFFDKRRRFWRIEDALTGEGEHTFRFFFHLAPGVAARVRVDGRVEVCDKSSGARLFLTALDGPEVASLEPRWSSNDYGAKRPSQSVCWTVRARAPLLRRFALLPVCAGESEDERFAILDF